MNNWHLQELKKIEILGGRFGTTSQTAWPIQPIYLEHWPNWWCCFADSSKTAPPPQDFIFFNCPGCQIFTLQAEGEPVGAVVVQYAIYRKKITQNYMFTEFHRNVLAGLVTILDSYLAQNCWYAKCPVQFFPLHFRPLYNRSKT